jgi:hypothetical protein
MASASLLSSKSPNICASIVLHATQRVVVPCVRARVLTHTDTCGLRSGIALTGPGLIWSQLEAECSVEGKFCVSQSSVESIRRE